MTNTNARTAQEIKTAIQLFFDGNGDLFDNCIEELDDYNGFLDDDRYYPMEMLDELYHGEKATEILYRAFYGYDADNWHTDEYGRKENASFNPNRNYFKYNGYGNLVSTDYPDYSAHLDDYTIECMLDNRCYIDSIERDEELSALFDELENAQED